MADYAKYEVQTKSINFLPTLMYTARVFRFTLKNTSLINFRYKCRIASAESGLIDPGYFSVTPHEGALSPGCD